MNVEHRTLIPEAHFSSIIYIHRHNYAELLLRRMVIYFFIVQYRQILLEYNLSPGDMSDHFFMYW